MQLAGGWSLSNFYISPTGAGARSGASWADAGTLGSLPGYVGRAGAGGRVYIKADEGAYQLSSAINIAAGGTVGAPVTIKGVDSAGRAMDAVLVGTRPEIYSPTGPQGAEAIRLNLGANNLRIEGLDFLNVGTAIRVTGDIQNLTIKNIEAVNVGRFFENYASNAPTATITNLDIWDVTVDAFSKGVIRLRYDTNDVVIQNVRGDGRQIDGANFAIGVHLEGTVHDVLVRNTAMRNTRDTTSAYWNGDGFATERGVYDVVFDHTVASGNTDAGYDLKSTDTRLIGATASDNNRNFRFWATDTVADGIIGSEPNHRGGIGAAAQIWLAAGARATVTNASFLDGGTIETVFDLTEDNAVLTLDNVRSNIVDVPAHSRVAATSVLVGTVELIEGPASVEPMALEAVGVAAGLWSGASDGAAPGADAFEWAVAAGVLECRALNDGFEIGVMVLA